VGVREGGKAVPNTALQVDQCWHVNKTENFVLPGVVPLAPAPPAPPRPVPSTTAWGVSDLTIYITHWYNGVFTASSGEKR
jgi:hypothetical protein